MPTVDAKEVMDKLASFGPYNGAPEKQLYRTNLNGFTVRLVHPTMKTAVGPDGEPVNSDEELEVKGRKFIPKIVELPAQYTDDYIAKGFSIPTAEQLGEVAEALPAATDPELEALSKTELRAVAKAEGVELAEDERTSVIIAKILKARQPENPLDAMTRDELRAYAETHNIALGGATSKADIRAAIDAAAQPV